jgi:preprotein translocase subunit SecD
MQAPRSSTDSTAGDPRPALSDSATFAAVLQAGALPVPLRVTEVREIPPSALVPPALGLLALGLALGFLLGAWWRGRRAR